MTLSRLLPLCVLFALPVSAAEPSTKPIRLAAPGFSGVNVDEKVATFFSEHFAQKLSLQGISVMSSSEVSALVGLERQKQLMGCSEDSSSCLAELANALGADGIITGSIGKFGTTFQVNIKVLSATNATALSILSKKAYGEEDLLSVLDEAAEIAAFDIKEKLGRTGEAAERPRERERTVERGGDNAAPAGASAAPRKLNNVTVWGLGPLVGVYAIEFERALGSHASLFVQPAFLAGEYADGGTEYRSLSAELLGGARFYPLGLAPEGFFLGAELKASIGTFHGFSTGLAGSLGYTFRLGEFLVLSLGGGGGYYPLGGNPLVPPHDDNGFDYFLRSHLGFAF